MKNPILNFYNTAFGRYKMFVLPYITAALYFNKNAFAEVAVDHYRFFKKKHRKFLKKHFDGRYLLKPLPDIFGKMKDGKVLKSIRWLTIPRKKAKYTYIGDIDFTILEPDLHVRHAEYARETGKPYANYVRQNRINVTGLHFIVTEPYYKKINQDYLNWIVNQIRIGKIRRRYLDERILCRVIKEKCGLPKINIFRPPYGLHLSLRQPIVWWSRWASKWARGMYPETFDELINTDMWKEGMCGGIFDERFRKVINMYTDKAIPLGIRDHKLALRIREKEYSSKKELTELENERAEIEKVRIRFQ